GGLALRAAEPQSFGHPALRPHRRSRVGFHVTPCCHGLDPVATRARPGGRTLPHDALVQRTITTAPALLVKSFWQQPAYAPGSEDSIRGFTRVGPKGLHGWRSEPLGGGRNNAPGAVFGTRGTPPGPGRLTTAGRRPHTDEDRFARPRPSALRLPGAS